MEEKWAVILGFPNYEISNTGKIERVGKTKRTPVKVCRSVNYLYASIAYEPRKYKQINVKTMMDRCFTEHIYSDHSSNDFPGEVWKDVVDWEDLYEVSNLGRVRTKFHTRAGRGGSVVPVNVRIKQSYLDSDGYTRVSLYRGDESKLVGVHRLVAEAFIPNPEGLPQVNHINGIKADNRVENLEWVTNTGNIRHSIEKGLRNPKVWSYSIVRLSDNRQFASIAALHRELGGSYNELVHLFKVSDGEPVQIQDELYCELNWEENNANLGV